MAGLNSIGLPERKRNYRFALTPLADAMFQLLIFFMLSSGLTPYSLLTVQSGEVPADPQTVTVPQTDETAPDQPPIITGRVALWTIEADTIIVRGQRFPMTAVADLAVALGSGDSPSSVVLIIRPSAQVQDMTTVLARLSLANVASVQVSTGAP